MRDQGEKPEMGFLIDTIYRLPPDERAARFAEELAFEGRTFRAFLEVLRFMICTKSVRTALVGVMLRRSEPLPPQRLSLVSLSPIWRGLHSSRQSW